MSVTTFARKNKQPNTRDAGTSHRRRRGQFRRNADIRGYRESKGYRTGFDRNIAQCRPADRQDHGIRQVPLPREQEAEEGQSRIESYGDEIYPDQDRHRRPRPRAQGQARFRMAQRRASDQG